jgi:hypothetical protein
MTILRGKFKIIKIHSYLDFIIHTCAMCQTKSGWYKSKVEASSHVFPYAGDDDIGEEGFRSITDAMDNEANAKRGLKAKN